MLPTGRQRTDTVRGSPALQRRRNASDTVETQNKRATGEPRGPEPTVQALAQAVVTHRRPAARPGRHPCAGPPRDRTCGPKSGASRCSHCAASTSRPAPMLQRPWRPRPRTSPDPEVNLAKVCESAGCGVSNCPVRSSARVSSGSRPGYSAWGPPESRRRVQPAPAPGAGPWSNCPATQGSAAQSTPQTLLTQCRRCGQTSTVRPSETAAISRDTCSPRHHNAARPWRTSWHPASWRRSRKPNRKFEAVGAGPRRRMVHRIINSAGPPRILKLTGESRLHGAKVRYIFCREDCISCQSLAPAAGHTAFYVDWTEQNWQLGPGMARTQKIFPGLQQRRHAGTHQAQHWVPTSVYLHTRDSRPDESLFSGSGKLFILCWKGQ